MPVNVRSTFGTGPGIPMETPDERNAALAALQQAQLATQANIAGAGYQSQERLGRMQADTARYSTDAQRAMTGDYSQRAADQMREAQAGRDFERQMRDTSLDYMRYNEIAPLRQRALQFGTQALDRMGQQAPSPAGATAPSQAIDPQLFGMQMAMAAMSGGAAPNLIGDAMAQQREEAARQRQQQEGVYRNAMEVAATIDPSVLNPSDRQLYAQARQMLDSGDPSQAAAAIQILRRIQESVRRPRSLSDLSALAPEAQQRFSDVERFVQQNAGGDFSRWYDFGGPSYANPRQDAAEQEFRNLAEAAARAAQGKISSEDLLAGFGGSISGMVTNPRFSERLNQLISEVMSATGGAQ